MWDELGPTVAWASREFKDEQRLNLAHDYINLMKNASEARVKYVDWAADRRMAAAAIPYIMAKPSSEDSRIRNFGLTTLIVIAFPPDLQKYVQAFEKEIQMIVTQFVTKNLSEKDLFERETIGPNDFLFPLLNQKLECLPSFLDRELKKHELSQFLTLDESLQALIQQQFSFKEDLQVALLRASKNCDKGLLLSTLLTQSPSAGWTPIASYTKNNREGIDYRPFFEEAISRLLMGLYSLKQFGLIGHGMVQPKHTQEELLKKLNAKPADDPQLGFYYYMGVWWSFKDVTLKGIHYFILIGATRMAELNLCMNKVTRALEKQITTSLHAKARELTA
jgi:hypothetical protein